MPTQRPPPSPSEVTGAETSIQPSEETGAETSTQPPEVTGAETSTQPSEETGAETPSHPAEETGAETSAQPANETGTETSTQSAEQTVPEQPAEIPASLPAAPAFPEIYREKTFAGITVKVYAPEGVFREGSYVEITPVLAKDVMDFIDGIDDPNAIAAFDITFYSREGQELQPPDGKTVDVCFEVAPVSVLAQDDATLQVYHVDDQQNATAVGGEVASSSQGAEVAVEAKSFSVYIVTAKKNGGNIDQEYALTTDTVTAAQLLIGLGLADEDNVNSWFVQVSKNSWGTKDLFFDNAISTTGTSIKWSEDYNHTEEDWYTIGGKASVCSKFIQVSGIANGDTITFHVGQIENGLLGTEWWKNDYTITLTFNKGDFTVSLNAGQGTINSGDVTAYSFGTEVNLPTDITAPDGYTFTGWKNDDTDEIQTQILSDSKGDLKFTAQYDKNPTLTVAYQYADGSKALESVSQAFELNSGATYSVKANGAVTYTVNGVSKELTVAAKVIPNYQAVSVEVKSESVTGDVVVIVTYKPINNQLKYFVQINSDMAYDDGNVTSHPINRYSENLADKGLTVDMDKLKSFVVLKGYDKVNDKGHYTLLGSQIDEFFEYCEPGSVPMSSAAAIDKINASTNSLSKELRKVVTGTEDGKINAQREDYRVKWTVLKFAGEAWHIDGILTKVNYCTITYMANDNTIATPSYQAGSKVELLKGLPSTSDEYAITGWTTEDKVAFTGVNSISGDIIVSATLKKPTITIHYMKYPNDTSAITLPEDYKVEVPTGTSYNLGMWNGVLKYTAPKGEQVIVTPATIVGYAVDRSSAADYDFHTLTAEDIELNVFYKHITSMSLQNFVAKEPGAIYDKGKVSGHDTKLFTENLADSGLTIDMDALIRFVEAHNLKDQLYRGQYYLLEKQITDFFGEGLMKSGSAISRINASKNVVCKDLRENVNGSDTAIDGSSYRVVWQVLKYEGSSYHIDGYVEKIPDVGQQTYHVSYYINGALVHSDPANAGSHVDLWNGTVNIPSGYTFGGWVSAGQPFNGVSSLQSDVVVTAILTPVNPNSPGYSDNDDDDDDTTPVTIPDNTTPLAESPISAEPTAEIPDGETPLTDVPGDTETEIPDETTPLAQAPKTGDCAAVWVGVAAVSGVGLVWLVLSGKRRKNNDAQ